MKKSAAPILILVFLLVAVGIFVVFRISKNNASDTQNPETTATATPEPTATTPPTATPEPTGTPVPTAVPTETPVPTVQPTAAPVQDQSGEFRSDTGTYINIVVKWTVTGSGGTKTLKLDTYVESYALVTGDRTSDVVFNVGGNVSYASSKAIRLDNVPLTQTFLGSTSVDVTSGTDVPVNVTWHFNGTYSNQNIATIVAEDTLHIN
mgnify:CR=1 FL=1